MQGEDTVLKLVDLNELKDKNIQLLVLPDRRDEILNQIGYAVNPLGDLIEKDGGKNIFTEDGVKINLHKMKKLALIGGSHIFVRNIAGYSQILAQKKEFKFVSSSKKE